MSPSSETVLLTGATGFVGSQIALQLLEKGYRIRATAANQRFQKKADAWSAKYPHSKKSIEWAIVPSLETPGAFDSLMEGVDHVIHTATPVMLGFEDNEKDMLIPAIEGAMSVLRAAAKKPRIRRVIMTGSFGAIGGDKAAEPGRVFTPADWNETTYEEAAQSPPGTAYVYAASKALAEKAAWKFMETENPPFTLTSLCFPIIYGPPAQVIESMDALPASCAEMWAIFSGKQQDLSKTPWPWWVDVRDVAKLHVDSLTNDKAHNQRYLGCAGYQCYGRVAHIAAKAFPEQASRIAVSDDLDPPPHAILDASKAERDFDMKWINLEACITDMAREMYAREYQLLGGSK